jgi:hypothetical protein
VKSRVGIPFDNYTTHAYGRLSLSATMLSHFRLFRSQSYMNGSCWICDVEVFWIHIRNDEAKAFRTFIPNHSLFKTQRLSSNIILTFHKALIRSVMAYACPAWGLPADAYLLNLQHLQNKVLRTTENFPTCTPTAICTRLSTFRMYTITHSLTELSPS